MRSMGSGGIDASVLLAMRQQMVVVGGMVRMRIRVRVGRRRG